MTKEILQAIADLKDIKKIQTEIETNSKYFDKDKDKVLKKISIVPIIQSEGFVLLDRVRTDEYAYDLGFTNYVKDCPKYQFIWLQVDKYSKKYNAWMPKIIKMYAREKVVEC